MQAPLLPKLGKSFCWCHAFWILVTDSSVQAIASLSTFKKFTKFYLGDSCCRVGGGCNLQINLVLHSPSWEGLTSRLVHRAEDPSVSACMDLQALRLQGPHFRQETQKPLGRLRTVGLRLSLWSWVSKAGRSCEVSHLWGPGARSWLYRGFPAQASGQFTVSQVWPPLRGHQLTPVTPSHPFNNFTFSKDQKSL